MLSILSFYSLNFFLELIEVDRTEILRISLTVLMQESF